MVAELKLYSASKQDEKLEVKIKKTFKKLNQSNHKSMVCIC